MTLIVLVRHGQTEWNRVERFRGQAEATAQRIAAEWRPVAVYSSPLSRAVKTAEVIARHLGLPVQTHGGLTDIDYGQ